MTLDAVPTGTRVVVAEVRLPVERRLRLAEMGVRPGSTVQVLGRTAGGGRIVAVGTGRMAINGWIAERLVASAVVPAETDDERPG